MTRREFLNELYRRLGKMSREEAEQYLTYYAEMLADRMEEGMTEEEAVASMEDVETIAARIRQERAEEGASRNQEPQPPGGAAEKTETDTSPREPEGETRKENSGAAWPPPRRRPKWAVPAVVIAGVLLLVAALGSVIRYVAWRTVVKEPTISLGLDGIQVEDDGTSVSIGLGGIRVEDDGTSVSIGPGGIQVEDDENTSDWTYEDWPVDDDSGWDVEASSDYQPGGKYTVSAEGIQAIEVDWVSGGVWIEPWDGEEILLTEESTVELDEETALCYEVVDSTLSIRFSREPLTNFNGGKALTVQLPRALAEGGLAGLSVETTSADVDMEGVSGRDLEISTTSGNATVYGGSFSAAALATTSGDMTMAGDVPEVELSSTSGDLTLEGGGSLLDVTVSTVSGDVLVLLPEDSETVRLDWETASGDLDTGGHAVIQGGGSGLSGEAGVALRVSTVSGDLLLA